MSNKRMLWEYLKDEKLRLFIYVFLVILTYLPSLLASFFWGIALEALILGNFTKFTMFLAIWEGTYILFYAIISVPKDSIYNYLEIKFNKRVIKDLYTKIVNLPAIAHEEIGVGEFINRLTTDPERVMELISKLIRMVCKSLVVVVVFVIAFKVSILVGIEILVFALIMGFISYKFFPKIKKTQESIKKKSDKYVKQATEDLNGLREINALGIKQNILNRMFFNIDDLFKDNRKIRKYEIAYSNLNNLIYFCLQFIILFTCGYLLINGKMSYSIFIVIQSYIWRIDEVVESISDFGVNYNKVKVSLNRINDIVNNKLYNDCKYGGLELQNPQGVIEFKDVKFKYRDDEEYTLNGLNLSIVPNKKISIVGRSGNGKTTLFNLLLRYFDCNSGKITIDGIDIEDLTEKSLRDNISIIRQSPFIFNLTIFENFKLVKPNVTLEEVKNVCKLSYISDYIESLPNKYDTLIGEGGVNLSGGQKQRLAIARTLLLNTKIILFDEATSALDNESQEYIKKTIDNLSKSHTVVIVAHRLSTIIDSDLIYVIDKGKLIGRGTHKELLKKCDVYKNLYLNESSDKILE